MQAKLQNGLCSCTSWGYMWKTNEMYDTYPTSSWYKLLKIQEKVEIIINYNFGQKYPKTDTGYKETKNAQVLILLLLLSKWFGWFLNNWSHWSEENMIMQKIFEF